MPNDIVVYDYDASPCVRRVKITLIEKGLEYRIQSIDLSKMQQKSLEYLAINPNGLVPTLSLNGRILYESAVINDYLEDQFPSISLQSDTVEGQLEVRKWQSYELAMAKIYRSLMYARVMGPLKQVACSQEENLQIAKLATQNAGHLAWEAKVWNLQVLTEAEQQVHEKQLYAFAERVERQLEGKRYLVDDKFTFADIAVYPRLTMFPIIGVKINRYSFPNIQRWCQRLEQRRSISSTQSPAQQSMLKLRETGLLNWLHSAFYGAKGPSLMDRFFFRLLKPVLRKKLKIDVALNNSALPKKTLLLAATPYPIQEQPALRLKSGSGNDPAADLTLYGCSQIPTTERIKWVLSYFNIAYQCEEVCEQNASLAALNPTGEWPMLCVTSQMSATRNIIDAEVIAEYLESVHHSQVSALERRESLFSDTAYEMAQVRMWNAFDGSMEKSFAPYLMVGPNRPEASELKNCLNLIQEKMDLLENALIHKAYLVGEHFTYADIALYSRIRLFENVGLGQTLIDKPSINQWLARINEKYTPGIKEKTAPNAKTVKKAKPRKENASNA